MGFKPIFEEERQFFKTQTGINLPLDCWRNASKIYFDFTQPKPLIEFKVENGKINVTKDRRNGYIEHGKQMILPSQKSLSELIETNRDRLNDIYKKSVLLTVEMIEQHPDCFFLISHSGGKDSTLAYLVWQDALKRVEHEPEWTINFANTSNDTAETYKEIKRLPQDKLRILNPEIGYYQWIANVKNYFLPSTRVRNCCSVYKEGQVKKSYDNQRKTINLTGVRSHESIKRSSYQPIMTYDWAMKNIGSFNLPKNWISFAPLCEDWKDEDVWLYLLMTGTHFNPMYKYGFNRVGCLICPFQQAYTDLLIQYWYPKAWERWLVYLHKNYEITHVKQNLKWTFDEWANGEWKRAVSKEYGLINSKPTKEKIKELAELKGISDEMAAKYFQKTCSCGKKLNPTEIAMFYKTQGRQEGQEDNRTVLCKKCLCNKLEINLKEYSEMARNFLDDGCSLF